jgi:hypothetical protein
LVKKNFQWIFFNFIENRIVLDKIKDFNCVNDSEDENLVIIRQDNN